MPDRTTVVGPVKESSASSNNQQLRAIIPLSCGNMIWQCTDAAKTLYLIFRTDIMPNIDEIMEDIETHGRVSFSRSAGPGGQNVNKLNTSVFLAVPVESFTCLSPADKDLLRERLSGRINSDDELFVRAGQQRSQLRNRRYAVMRMAELVHDNLKKNAPRKKTKPSRAAKERRLNDKKRRSELKKSRRPPD